MGVRDLLFVYALLVYSPNNQQEVFMRPAALLPVLLLCAACASSPEATIQTSKSASSDQSLKINESENGCFAIGRNAQDGGLKIPDQKVCPTAKP